VHARPFGARPDDTLTTVARLSYPRQAGPAPQALPPAERTVGQVVAESIKLYGAGFFPSLLLGIPAAAIVALAAWVHGAGQVVAILVAGSLLSAAALAGAVRLAHPEAGRRAVSALAAGVVAFAPVLAARVVVFPGIYLLALVWLAGTIFSVPAILVEGVSLRQSFRRSLRLMRADAVHAVGALATLTIVIVVTALVLTFLLRGFGNQGIRVAALIALLVLTPLFFLGSAVLYADQAARVRVEPHD
jgi:hypothetical protein